MLILTADFTHITAKYKKLMRNTEGLMIMLGMTLLLQHIDD